MNDRDALRLAARRAALHASIRAGDAQGAARAAARLRLPGARLTAQEITFARDTRAALGRALIAARLPRPAPVPAPAREIVHPRGIPWKRLAVAEPSAAPTAAPTEAPSPAPSAGAGGTGGAGGSATGAGGGGGGIGIGAGPGLITVPTPRPTSTPRVPPPGYGRLTIIVLDRQTLKPVPDTCVSFGSLTCTTITAGDVTALSYRTDENGRWSLDVPLGAPTVSYDMLFFKLGYRVDIEKVTLRRGGTVVKTVFLVKQG